MENGANAVCCCQQVVRETGHVECRRQLGREFQRSRYKGYSSVRAALEPCFIENLAAALALIHCAGFNAAASTTMTIPMPFGPGIVQVIPSCCEVFRGWVL